MRRRFIHRAMLGIFFLCQLSICLATEAPDANDSSKYLNAVRGFADNVLKYGRDTYGPKHTPLFVDGLNIHTYEPVKWRYKGQVWILSDLASQQNLFRTLDGLTKMTGDPKYRQAAVEAIDYAFAKLRSPNGLLYWGKHIAYDAQGDKLTIHEKYFHELKHNHPYYELMWQVNPDITKQFIEAFWSAHILNWSNLDMDRHGRMGSPLQKSWDYEYEGGQVFFETKGKWAYSSPAAATDLYCAAAILSMLSGEEKPLIWSKRLAHRFIETRMPKTSISGSMFTRRGVDPAQSQFGDDFNGHLVLQGTLWPPQPAIPGKYVAVIPRKVLFEIQLESVIKPRISQLLVGEALGKGGKEFTHWAIEELTACGKVAYRKDDNSFIPMLTDGTSLLGYTFTKDGPYGPKGTVVEPIPVGSLSFWTYALAYRVTGNVFMWEMACSIAKGNGFGNIGVSSRDTTQLRMSTDCSDPFAVLGFLELYRQTAKSAFLEMACRIGDNILANRFLKGFFVPSKEHLYTKFDYIEPLVLLHLDAAVNVKLPLMPQVWPSRSFFECHHDGQKHVKDTLVIYSNTKATELIRLLCAAAWAGKIDEVRSLISKGADVNAGPTTALHYAAERGHNKMIELLIAKGADINAKTDKGETAISLANKKGHTEIVELLRKHAVDDLPKANATKSKRFNDVADLVITGETGGRQNFGGYLSHGDVNGDGYEDLLTTASNYDNNRGRAYLYFGGPGMDANADKIFAGENQGNLFGERGLCLSDLNNDGFDEVIVGALGYNSRQGRVYVFYGGLDMDENADMVLDGETAGINFGQGIAIGDVNNDGYDDLFVAAPKYENYKGRVYLYYGGVPFDTAVDKTFTGENTDDTFPREISARGDVDGDGCNDLLIGTRFWPKLEGTGRVYLYYGGPESSMDTTCDKIFDSPVSGRNDFGSAIDLFDIDNDCHSDVIIGARMYNRGQGRGYLYWGSSRVTMDNVVDEVFEGEAGVNSNMGGDSVYCGCVNNDKFGDIIFAGYAYNRGRGRAYLYYGNTKASMDVDCDHTFTGDQAKTSFSLAVKLADLNGDGYEDIVAGGYLYNNHQGRVWIYLNNPPSSK